MSLKKEVRLLLLSEIDNYIIATVIRGHAGVEGIAIFEDCTTLQNMIKSKKGILAEVNYIVEADVCRDLDLKAVQPNKIEDKDILEAVIETQKILFLMKIRFVQTRVQYI